MDSTYPKISLIIPVHDGGTHFKMCLASVRALDPAPEEFIVVADGDKASGAVAEAFGARVFSVNEAGGPARARNLGARMADKDILFFADADVTLPPDAVSRVRHVFQGTDGVAAVFGSYDDDPFEENFLSQYKNLLHHYVHQNSKDDASTFWGACGAIKRDVFLELGGFDEKYRRPMIEDIEFGYRVKAAGHRILLDKGLQVKHLKHWGPGSLLKADILCRALPWTRLILEKGGLINDLNLRLSDRISVTLVYLLLLAVCGLFVTPWFLLLSGVCALMLLFINRTLYRFFRRKRGMIFVVKAIPWHWFYFFYSGLGFMLGFSSNIIRKTINKKRRTS